MQLRGANDFSSLSINVQSIVGFKGHCIGTVLYNNKKTQTKECNAIRMRERIP